MHMLISHPKTKSILDLRAGEMVEVRSKSEILATLDATGRMEGLPFMPEMLQYSGKRFTVYKRADKACDTVAKTGSRRMGQAVHLEGVRCDGMAHGGCQAGCLIYWKEAWLKPVEDAASDSTTKIIEAPASTNRLTESTRPSGVCTEETLFQATRGRPAVTGVEEEIFSCQATELPNATSYLAWWDVRQYVRDVRSRNIGLVDLARGMSISLFNTVIQNIRHGVFAVGRRLGPGSVEKADRGGDNTEPTHGFSRAESPRDGSMEYLKNALDRLLTGYPHVRGRLRKTPATLLNLQPGEFVQVKSKEEIVATLDIHNKNRGLSFDVEMVRYCEGTYQVLRRVEKIVDERTGKMLRLPNHGIILDGVVCRGCLSPHRLFCPRSIYPYWREIWLRRAERS